MRIFYVQCTYTTLSLCTNIALARAFHISQGFVFCKQQLRSRAAGTWGQRHPPPSTPRHNGAIAPQILADESTLSQSVCVSGGGEGQIIPTTLQLNPILRILRPSYSPEPADRISFTALSVSRL